jgi:hypothetical protein
MATDLHDYGRKHSGRGACGFSDVLGVGAGIPYIHSYRACPFFNCRLRNSACKRSVKENYEWQN